MPSGATSEGAAAAVDGSLELLLWRSSLQRGPAVPDPDDQLDWADRCFALGLGEPARLLYETAFLHQGFSPQQLAHRAARVGRTGFGQAAAETTEPDAPAADGTVALAVAELRRLARAIAPRLSPSRAGERDVGFPLPDDGLPDDIGALAHRLHAFLGGPPPGHGWNGAAALIARLRTICRSAPPVDYRTFGAAPLPLLAGAIGFVSLTAFMLENDDLMAGQGGSPELLYRAARLDSGGLGPYLANVRRIARKSRDVFELAAIARDAAEEAGWGQIGLDPWFVLLSRALSGALLDEVVDDLGDAGATAVLAAIYDRAASRPEHRIPVALIYRLRDAALDNGDLDLAIRAQALIVRVRPDQPIERVILGSIEGTAGLIASAEQTFLTCSAVAPGFGDVTARLVALRTRAFEPYEVRAGFGTPADRAITRRNRRAAVRTASRIQRSHPVAVEL